MSRIGKKPIEIPQGVSVEINGRNVVVKGSRGELSYTVRSEIKVSQTDGVLTVEIARQTGDADAYWGLTRALIANMILGVSEGFEKKLELNGVGYRVQAQGEILKFNLGFSHEVVYKIGNGVSANVDQNIITLSGADKQRVGQVAAEIRALKKPEPYKGKGIRYQDEKVRRKAGKSAKEKSGE